MVPHPTSRRRLLGAAAGVLVTGVAGCNGRVTGGGPETPTATETAQPTLDYDAVVVRNAAAEPFVRHGADAPAGDSDEYLRETLVTAADANRVSFTAEVPGVDEARRLLRETDFERSVVHVSEHPVGECRALTVDYVTVDGDSFDLDFCSPLRPADVACRADAREVAAAFVRFPMETDDVGGYTVGRGGSCERPRRREESA